MASLLKKRKKQQTRNLKNIDKDLQGNFHAYRLVTEDILHSLLVDSDPLITCMQSVNKSRRKMDKKVLELLQSPYIPNTDSGMSHNIVDPSE